MFDLKWICENPDLFDEGMIRRGVSPKSREILKFFHNRKEIQIERQELQSKRNSIAKQIGNLKESNISELRKEAAAIKEKLPILLNKEVELNAKLEQILQELPNLPYKEVPDGLDEDSNKCLRLVGRLPEFKFKPLRHFDLGEKLNLMDFRTASIISGSRFVILKGLLSKLERAIASFMLDLHVKKFGFVELSLPFLVRRDTMFGSGQLPKFGEDSFETTDKRWLIPTAEVPLVNLVREKILEKESLPLRFVAYTPCFRSEAGAAGKDNRGMIRNHQFSKVELVSVTSSLNSEEEHNVLLNAAEEVLKLLKLPYRVMMLCAGEMGASAHKAYDLEVWLPGENKYREISSCSNCGDFQARRMNSRFRSKNDKKLQFVHILNSSGLAVGRTLVAILENYQKENGDIEIPEVLIPYMDGIKLLKKDETQKYI